MYVLPPSQRANEEISAIDKGFLARLSFIEAFRQKQSGTISWDEYLRHLLARCTGVEHEDDDESKSHWELRDADPFGFSICCWSNRIDNVKDTNPFEAVFKAYRTGSTDDVRDKLASLSDEHAKCIRKSLSLLALQERRADVLKLCLDQGGFPYEAYFEDEANVVDENKDSETFEVLEQSRFRQVYPRRPPGDVVDDEEEPFPFDTGGSHPVEW